MSAKRYSQWGLKRRLSAPDVGNPLPLVWISEPEARPYGVTVQATADLSFVFSLQLSWGAGGGRQQLDLPFVMGGSATFYALARELTLSITPVSFPGTDAVVIDSSASPAMGPLRSRAMTFLRNPSAAGLTAGSSASHALPAFTVAINPHGLQGQKPALIPPKVTAGVDFFSNHFPLKECPADEWSSVEGMDQVEFTNPADAPAVMYEFAELELQL